NILKTGPPNPAETTEGLATVPRPSAVIVYVPVVLWSTIAPDAELRFAICVKFPAPSRVASPHPLGFVLTAGVAVDAEKVPKREAFENPPAGAADCGSRKPKPTPALNSRKKPLFLSTRYRTRDGLVASPYQPLMETRPPD